MNGNVSVHTETELRVGYARTDITPTEPVPLRGYGNASHRMSERVLSPLCATCLAVTDGRGETVLIYALDLCECTLPWRRR